MVKHWKQRREILGWDIAPEVRLAALIAVEHFDWTTGEKEFASKHAFLQWVWGLSKRYNIVARDLKEAVTLMKEAGAIVVTAKEGDVRLMTLAEPTNVAGAIEAYYLRKQEESNGEIQ